VQYHGKVNQHPKEDQISRYPDTQRDLRPVPTMRHDCFRRFGQALVTAAALALIALTWIGARDAILAHRTEARARVQAEVVGKALAFEELLRREMLSLDQALRILEYDWQRDPTRVSISLPGPGRWSRSTMSRCSSSLRMHRELCGQVPVPPSWGPI
jgi:hypothetical protein